MASLDDLRKRAARNLEAFAGTRRDEAAILAAANELAAAEEALEALAGGPAPFSSIANQRGARLARVTRKFNDLRRARDPSAQARMLTEPEVQVIFRVPSATAKSTTQRMRAMFPELQDELLLLDISGGHEKTSAEGTPRSGRSLKVKFKNNNALHSAHALLARRDLLGKCDVDDANRTLTFAFNKTTKSEVEAIVRDVLELDLPT